MSYYEIIDCSQFTKDNEPLVLKRTRTFEEAMCDRTRLSSQGNILKIIKKFEFLWDDKDKLDSVF